MKVSHTHKVIVLGNPCAVTDRLVKSFRATQVEGIPDTTPSKLSLASDTFPPELDGYRILCGVDTPSARIAYLIHLATSGELAKDDPIAVALEGLTREEAVLKLIELSKAEGDVDWRLKPQKEWMTGAKVTYLSPSLLPRFANHLRLPFSLNRSQDSDHWMSNSLKTQCDEAYAQDTKRLKTLVLWNEDNGTPVTAYGECLPCKQKQAKAAK